MPGVTVIDRGWNRLFVEAEALASLRVKCGVFEDSPAYPDGTSVVTVAAVNEFGAPEKNIPARPWKETTENSIEVLSGLHDLLDTVVEKVLLGRLSLQEAGDAIGRFFCEEQKVTLMTHPWPPNALATLRKKHGSSPLIDTQHLLTSISYRVFL